VEEKDTLRFILLLRDSSSSLPLSLLKDWSVTSVPLAVLVQELREWGLPRELELADLRLDRRLPAELLVQELRERRSLREQVLADLRLER